MNDVIRPSNYLGDLRHICECILDDATEGDADTVVVHRNLLGELRQALRSSNETRACDGCERGLPLDGYGHHYSRISNTGPLAPYYLDLTACTRLSLKAKVGETLTPETSPLSEKCPKCGKHMFNWPGNLTKCLKCQHEWYMDSSTKGKLP